MATSLAHGAAGLGSHRGAHRGSQASTGGSWPQFSQVPPSSAHAANNLKSPCSSNQVAPRWARMAANISLHQSPFQEAPESTHLVAGFTPHQRTTQPAPQTTHLRSRLLWHQSSTKVTPPLWPRVHTTAYALGQPSQPVGLRVSPTH